MINESMEFLLKTREQLHTVFWNYVTELIMTRVDDVIVLEMFKKMNEEYNVVIEEISKRIDRIKE